MKQVLCSRCKKRPAMFFVTKVDGDKTTQEGLCIKCALEMNIGPVKQIMETMGISEDEIDEVSEQFEQMFGEEGCTQGVGDEGELAECVYPQPPRLVSSEQRTKGWEDTHTELVEGDPFLEGGEGVDDRQTDTRGLLVGEEVEGEGEHLRRELSARDIRGDL